MADRESLESRLSRVETAVEALTRTVGDYIDTNRHREEGIYRRFDAFQASLSEMRKTNWPTVIGFGSIVIVLGGMMAGLIHASIQGSLAPLQVTQSHHSKTIREHQNLIRDRSLDFARIQARQELLYGFAQRSLGPRAQTEASREAPGSRP